MLLRNHLFSQRAPIMNRALDTYALRQRTISKNIANVDSPHYRPENVKFEEYFNNQEVVLKGETPNSNHIPIGAVSTNDVQGEVGQAPVPKPEVYFSGETHVNIDKEMSNMAQNQIRFRFTSQMMGRLFKGMTAAITGTVNNS
jgi:flagellar basal-body rod protein FlgB